MNDCMQSRLRSKSTVQPNGCWEFIGCVQANGYARIRSRGNTMYAHRAAHVAFIGPIPNGKDVCHTCDNRRCINPAHLFLGSRTDNMRDAMNKGRLSSGARHSALVSGDRCGAARLTQLQVDAIRHARKQGTSIENLAAMTLVTVDNIRKILSNTTWKETEKCVA